MTTIPTTARSRSLDPVRPGDLVAMIGCAASGKSSALLTVPPYQIVSLDVLRAIVSEPGDQAATADALLLQHQILSMRLRRGLTTFVDNVSCERHHRLQLVDLAHAHRRRAVAVLTDTPLDLCLARNARRSTRWWKRRRAAPRTAPGTAATRIHADVGAAPGDRMVGGVSGWPEQGA